MIIDFKIFEHNRSYLYHFTNFQKLEMILKHGLFFSNIEKRDEIFSISTTRNSNFNWGFVRIVLDTEKIKSKYKIKSYDFFGDSFYNNFKKKNWPPDPNYEWDQQEERIISNKQGYLKPYYFLQIDIDERVFYHSSFLNNPHSLEDFENPYNIKINIINKFETIKPPPLLTEGKKTGLKKISKQEAIDKKMFGPVYHGSRQENWKNIFDQGFKIFYKEPSNSYSDQEYEFGYPPPLHHLGYGIYFTTVKSIAKKFNFGSEKNLKEFYLDIHNINQFNFRSSKKMMQWWLNNGYDGNLGKKDRYKATKKMTDYLKSKFDAVWFKNCSRFPTLDGDQIVVFDTSKIYMIDESLSGKKEIGSNVVAVKDIMKGRYDWGSKKLVYDEIDIPKGTMGKITDKNSTEYMFKNYNDKKEHWAYGSDYVYTVKWKKGGTRYNILDDQID